MKQIVLEKSRKKRARKNLQQNLDAKLQSGGRCMPLKWASVLISLIGKHYSRCFKQWKFIRGIGYKGVGELMKHRKERGGYTK